MADRVVDGSVVAAVRGATDVARAVRRDAVAARWRAQATRLTRRDMRVQMAWTRMQVARRHDGEYGFFSPLPRHVVHSLDK